MKKLFSPHLLFSLGILIIAGALLAGQIYFLTSITDSMTVTQKAMSEKRAEIAKAAALKNATQALGTSEEVISSHLLQKENIVPFLTSFETAGNPVGATGHVVSVSEEKIATHPKVSVSILINGSFDAVMRTVGILENSPYDSELTGLTLDSGGPIVKGVQQWSGAAVFSVGLERQATTTAKKP